MRKMDTSTEELIRSLNQGYDFEEKSHALFNLYSSRVYRFFAKKKIWPEECLSLTQEVFIAVFKELQRGHLRQPERFESWLASIARNKYYEWRRAKAQKPSLVSLEENVGHPENPPSTLLWLADRKPNPEQALLSLEWEERVDQALQELPEQQRICCQLRFLDDYSYAEIAALLGITTNTVSAHLYQAKKALQKKLGPEGWDYFDGGGS